MAETKTTDETTRSLDGTELVRLATSGANWKVLVSALKTFFSLSPSLVTPALGTPSSGVATNLTGTASGLTAGAVTTNANLTGDVTSIGNSTTLTNAPVIAKVLTGYTSGAGSISATDSILQAIQKLNGNDATNANLTGVITSSGNTTSISSQTGTGTKFVVDTSPTLVTPVLGVATATSVALGGATIGSNTLAVTGPFALTPTAGSAAITIAGVTSIVSSPMFTATQTINGAVDAVGIFYNMLPGGTPPNTSAMLLNLQYNSADVLRMFRSGTLNVSGPIQSVSGTSTFGSIQIANGTGNLSVSGTDLIVGTTNTTIGVSGASSYIMSPSTAVLQLGKVNTATAAVPQILQAQGSSGNSAAAALFTIAGSDQSGTTTTGGGVKIRAGNGTTAGGTVEIWTSATTTPAVAATFTAAKQTKLAGNLWLDNALVTGLTPAVSAGLLSKSIILYDNTGAAITVYGS